MSGRLFHLSSGLFVLGLGTVGAAGAALANTQTSEHVFAQQFLIDGAPQTAPAMSYSPELQMMVDPTGQPVYQDAKHLRYALPKVTSGCGDCPKKDDDGPNLVPGSAKG